MNKLIFFAQVFYILIFKFNFSKFGYSLVISAVMDIFFIGVTFPACNK